MVRKARDQSRTNLVEIARPTRKPKFSAEEERILREAVKYLVFKQGHLLVPSGIREEQEQGARRWIISVALRYPTGFGGEVGDLLYDGQEFTFLTPPEVWKERARKIAEDPERIRLWNEYRASTLPAGEA
jgi:hypothetical protein